MDKKNKTTSISKNDEKFCVGLDIGTWKICATVLSNSPQEIEPTILGVGIIERKRNKGRHGKVDNIQHTTLDIESAINSAKTQSNLDFKSVVVGICNQNIRFQESRGVVSVNSQNRVITDEDVQRVLEEARQIGLTQEYQTIHVIPQEFIINNNLKGIVNPIGMSGNRLEVQTKVISALALDIKNISLCLEKNGLEVESFVFEPLATALAILDEDEMELGVAIVDVGELTTDVAIFLDGVMRFASSVPFAGRHITDDIRQVMNIVFSQAEEIKKQSGHCYIDTLRENRQIMVPGIRGRKPMTFSRKQICQVIQPRLAEIFELAKEELEKSNLIHRLGAGIVLTGGTVLIEGVEDLASDVFGMPVRIGYPSDLNYKGLAQEVNKPFFSTSVGLALWGLKNTNIKQETNKSSDVQRNGKKVGLWQKVVELFKNL
ncbi:MAG: cell division protein FtsA [Ignavibacteria bacterium]|nr:cell division protein FtsA [Ignavibacteria bacterium]